MQDFTKVTFSVKQPSNISLCPTLHSTKQVIFCLCCQYWHWIWINVIVREPKPWHPFLQKAESWKGPLNQLPEMGIPYSQVQGRSKPRYCRGIICPGAGVSNGMFWSFSLLLKRIYACNLAWMKIIMHRSCRLKQTGKFTWENSLIGSIDSIFVLCLTLNMEGKC